MGATRMIPPQPLLFFGSDTEPKLLWIYHPNLAQKLCKQFSELDSQRFSDGDWYKFTKSGITKEKAILAVCEACHADVSEIIAFGDDYADIGMLKLCGVGVAMDNAVQEVKDIADDITLSNEEDGVAAYLEKWIKRI